MSFPESSLRQARTRLKQARLASREALARFSECTDHEHVLEAEVTRSEERLDDFVTSLVASLSTSQTIPSPQPGSSSNSAPTTTAATNTDQNQVAGPSSVGNDAPVPMTAASSSTLPISSNTEGYDSLAAMHALTHADVLESVLNKEIQFSKGMVGSDFRSNNNLGSVIYRLGWFGYL